MHSKISLYILLLTLYTCGPGARIKRRKEVYKRARWSAEPLEENVSVSKNFVEELRFTQTPSLPRSLVTQRTSSTLCTPLVPAQQR